MEKFRRLVFRARTHPNAPLVFLAVAMSVMVFGAVLLALNINKRGAEWKAMMPVDQCLVVKEQTK